MPTEKAIQFFYDAAGYSYDPKIETEEEGRTAGALQLAKAEETATARAWCYVWTFDQDGCIGCECGSDDCACYSGREHESLICALYDAPALREAISVYIPEEEDHGRILASLGGICEASSDYRRVIEAELALEAIGDEIAKEEA